MRTKLFYEVGSFFAQNSQIFTIRVEIQFPRAGMRMRYEWWDGRINHTLRKARKPAGRGTNGKGKM